MLGFAPLASLPLGDDTASASSDATVSSPSAFAFGSQLGAAIRGTSGAGSAVNGGHAFGSSAQGGNAASAFATGKPNITAS